MARSILESEKIDKAALSAIEAYHVDTVREVANAVQKNEWVIVGMKTNPLVKKARQHLAAKGLQFQYLEYGGYTSQWRKRLAIKLWSGWPTYPQVFHKGKLVGGFTDLEVYLPK